MIHGGPQPRLGGGQLVHALAKLLLKNGAAMAFLS
jgi:hypothetical protein